MKISSALIVSAIFVVGTTGLFAQEIKEDTLRRETNELREIMSLDVMELMRAAKADFMQIKGATRDNEDLKSLVFQFGEKMETIDKRLKTINYQIVPRILNALSNGSQDSNPVSHQELHPVDNEAQYTGEQIAEKLNYVKPLGHASADSRRLEKLKSYISVTHFPNGGAGVEAILNSFDYNSHKVTAAEVITSAGRLKLLNQQVIRILSDVKGDCTRMTFAKLLVPHVVDLNVMNIDGIVGTFEYPIHRQEIADICSNLLL